MRSRVLSFASLVLFTAVGIADDHRAKNVAPSGNDALRAALNSFKKPVIESVTFEPDVVAFEGKTKYRVVVKSDTPVNWINSCLDTPIRDKMRWGGGHGAEFKKIDDKTYVYEGSVDFTKWDIPGDYVLRCLSVENEAKEKSAEFPPQKVKFTTLSKPEVTASTESIRNGGEVTFTVRVKSFAPANWINSSFEGPKGNIHGGGHGTEFRYLGNGEYEYSFKEKISKHAPSGKYTLSRVSVEARNQAESPTAETMTVQVDNPNEDTTRPEISDLKHSVKVQENGDTLITFKVTARSKSPVNWLNSSFEGPAGNIHGGGSGVTFKSLGSDLFEYTFTERISKNAPRGTYTLKNVSVENEGQNESTKFNPIKIEIE